MKDSIINQELSQDILRDSTVGSEQHAGSDKSPAMIGSTIKIKGDITGDENLVIAGTVEGNVELGAHEVSISESGKVSANVTAKVVKIAGEVKGDIVGREKVILSRSGNVRGNIVAPRVKLEDGAKFKGSIDMDPGEAAGRAPAPAKRAANDNNQKQSADTAAVVKSA